MLADQLDEVKRRSCRLATPTRPSAKVVWRVFVEMLPIWRRGRQYKSCIELRQEHPVLDALSVATSEEVSTTTTVRRPEMCRLAGFWGSWPLFAPFATHLHSELPKQVGELAHMDQERQAHLIFCRRCGRRRLVLPSDLARVTWPLEPQWAGPYPRDSQRPLATREHATHVCYSRTHARSGT